MNENLGLTFIQIKKLSKYIGYQLSAITILFILTACLSSSYISPYFGSHHIKDVITSVPASKIFQMVTAENIYFQEKNAPKSTNYLSASRFFKLATNIAFNDTRSFLGNELPGFSNFDSKILVAGAGTDYTTMPIESNVDIDQLEKNDNKEQVENKPIQTPIPPNTGLKTNGDVVHIYFSHNRESYAPGQSNSLVTVTDVGTTIANSLISRGIGTSVDKTDIGARLISKKKNYASSYDESREVVKEAMGKNKNLTYLIDVHRDSQTKKITTIDKDGLSYAKIAFIIGGENPNYEQNLQLANALHQKLDSLLPGLSRGVFQKSGKGTNGKYNQDLTGQSMLIEMGGVDNTAEELTRTSEVFAEAFSQYFWNAEAVNGHQNSNPTAR
ncbi:MAG: stage sporulation protein [Bacillales bacterium]|jgi:stage II sporulation protein P|nr:stage sporulation protein [Bacillales bacterium]